MAKPETAEGRAPAVTQPPPPRFRLLAVYRTAVRILLSYAGVWFAAKVRGSEWRERALPLRHRANARRLRETIVAVQGLFIKVGQLLSILANALPADFRGDLEALQDRIPARPLADIRDRLVAELGSPPEALFATFDAVPIASASLAQVHAATLASGERVAVKVQHKDIEATARRDLRAIRRILGLVQALLRIRGLLGVYEQVRQMIDEELDFRREADSIEAIAAGFRDDPEVGFPRVVRPLSTRRVLTTGFIEGVKITDFEGLRAIGVDRKALAERVLRAYCRMLFGDGLYHADPHPGNLLVQPGGRLVFLDFGAVARLSPGLKAGIPQLVTAIVRRDRDALLSALRRMGFVQRASPGDDVAQRVIDAVYTRFLESLEIESFDLREIRFDPKLKAEMLRDFGRLGITLPELAATFQIPRDWILLQRTFLLLLGLCTDLDPELRPLPVLQPYLAELAPGRDVAAWIRSLAKDWVLSAVSLPGEIGKLLRRAERGELEVRVRGAEASSLLLYGAVHQALFGLLALGAGALAYQAHLRGDAPFATGFAAAAGFWLAALGISLLRARRITRRLRRGG